MAYDKGLVERLRETFRNRSEITEKKMFGGIAFMSSGNMCCGIVGETLMARVGPEQYGTALSRPHARKMDFTGKVMKGFVYVDPEGFESDEDLESWVALCEAFVRTLPRK